MKYLCPLFSRRMKPFLKHLALFLLLPALLATVHAGLYIRRDIYSDFGKYSNYSWKYYYQPLGDLSTKKLIHSETPYNSFIFGSSRVTGLYACYLQHKTPGSNFFMFANFAETIGGIYAKMKFLDERGYRLENIVIYFDTDLTFTRNGECPTTEHYLLTGKPVVEYYYSHYRYFLPPYLDMCKFRILLGMHVEGKEVPDWHSDPVTNDCNHTCTDSVVENYGDRTLKKRFIAKIDSMKSTGYLYHRDSIQQYLPGQISYSELRILVKIRELLNQHKSEYSIIITPLYDQKKFHMADRRILDLVFGDRVYDFSGINTFTENEYNYPDRSHFKPWISKAIADSVILRSLPY